MVNMIDLHLDVYTELENQELSEAVRNLQFPENIKGAVRPFSEFQKPETSAVFLITDKAETIRSFRENPTKFLYLAFCGDYDEIKDCGEVLHGIFPKALSGEEMVFRCQLMIDRIRLIANEAFYKATLLTTIDSVPDMLWYKRIDGIHMLVNRAFTEIVHKPKSEIHGRDHFDIWDVPRPAEGNADFACAESEEIAIRTRKTYICDEPVKTREGMKQFTTYKTPVYDMFGNTFGTVGIGHDVTNFSNMGIELSILVDNLPFPMIIFSADWKVVRMNRLFMSLCKIEPEEEGTFDYKRWKMANLFPENEPENNANNHSVVQEFKMYRNDALKYYRVSEVEIHDYFGGISGYFVTMLDLTYQRAYEGTILKAANTDMLTGIFNRRYFYHFMNTHAFRPMMLFYLDLDNFKSVNDNFGHTKGDEVLIRTAKLIEQYFVNDTYARLGGDEFIIAVDLENAEYAKGQAQKLESALNQYFQSEGLEASVSIGISETDGTGNIDHFIHEADTRMYEVKNSKR